MRLVLYIISEWGETANNRWIDKLCTFAIQSIWFHQFFIARTVQAHCELHGLTGIPTQYITQNSYAQTVHTEHNWHETSAHNPNSYHSQ